MIHWHLNQSSNHGSVSTDVCGRWMGELLFLWCLQKGTPWKDTISLPSLIQQLHERDIVLQKDQTGTRLVKLKDRLLFLNTSFPLTSHGNTFMWTLGSGRGCRKHLWNASCSRWLLGDIQMYLTECVVQCSRSLSTFSRDCDDPSLAVVCQTKGSFPCMSFGSPVSLKVVCSAEVPFSRVFRSTRGPQQPQDPVKDGGVLYCLWPFFTKNQTRTVCRNGTWCRIWPAVSTHQLTCFNDISFNFLFSGEVMINLPTQVLFQHPTCKCAITKDFL